MRSTQRLWTPDPSRRPYGRWMTGHEVDAELVDAVRGFERVVRERDGVLGERLLHADFALVLVHPEPAELPRAEWLRMLPDYVVSEWTVERHRTDVDGDCAAVLQRVRMEAVVLGQDRSGIFLISDIWRHQAEFGWQIWRRHSSPISAGALPQQ